MDRRSIGAIAAAAFLSAPTTACADRSDNSHWQHLSDNSYFATDGKSVEARCWPKSNQTGYECVTAHFSDGDIMIKQTDITDLVADLPDLHFSSKSNEYGCALFSGTVSESIGKLSGNVISNNDEIYNMPWGENKVNGLIKTHSVYGKYFRCYIALENLMEGKTLKDISTKLVVR